MALRRLAILPLAISVILAGPGWAFSSQPFKIALSNSYAANSWRQAMLQSWARAASDAHGRNLVEEAPALTTEDNEAWQQAQQIEDLVHRGYQAIVINAASPTALNEAVKSACDAGVVVVSFDNIVSEPCAYRIAVDFRQLGAMQIDYFRKRGLEGKLLEVRGIPGTAVNDGIHDGVHEALRQGKGLRIVASVHGNWTEAVAEKAVASMVPNLPDIVAVTTQGGDGVGVAHAFQDAGRKPPVIFLGNRAEELAWWNQQHEVSGYETMSASIAPGSASFAFWFAQSILAGAKPPRDVTLPLLVITQETLSDALTRMGPDGVASTDYSQKDVADYLARIQE